MIKMNFKNFLISFCIICIPFANYSQQSYSYSDSIALGIHQTDVLKLQNMLETGDYDNFKIKFYELENIFKKELNYNGLFIIYLESISIYKKNILFNVNEIINEIKLLKENYISLSKENQNIFDLILVEYFSKTGEYKEAIKICNSHLLDDEINQKLLFYRWKTICEINASTQEALKTAYKTLEIAKSFYGEQDPELLPYLSLILLVDISANDVNSTKIATKALQILNDNDIQNIETSIEIWFSLGNVAINKKNLKDAREYYEKSLELSESNKVISNPIYYLSCLLQLANVNILESNFDLALQYNNKVKLYLNKNPQISQSSYGDYYYQLGDIYFHQDLYNEAKINYKKSFTYYGDNIIKTRNLNYILCDYFIFKDIAETINSLEQFQKNNNDIYSVSKIIYLLKYNSGDFISARNLLTSQLSTIISNNNQFFHLLSDTEKEILYKGFSDQFEFLNTYLLSNDKSFLSEYINFRFYSKSLLFSNSFKTEGINEKNKELFLELKSNTFQINKKLENKVSDTKTIEDLKNKNREIEKMLSANTKPLLVPTLKDLNTKLVYGEAYVEIVRINKQSRNATKKGLDIVRMFTDSISYGAIVIKKNSFPKFILIDGSNQLEKQYAFNFKTKIKSKQEDLESYNLLFEKIDNELKDVKKIYLVTDGIYNSINIESIYNPNRKQYLIDYLKVQQIQNVRVITEEKKEFKVGLNTKAILFGNPDFDLLVTDNNTASFSFDRCLDNSAIHEIKSSVKIGRLNGTQKEIETLDAILKNTKSTVEIFSKSTALEDNLKNIQSPDILHIATHGYFLSNDDTSKTKQSIANLINDNYKNDSYLKSGLLLAGAQNTLNGNQPENSNNGILTAEEAKSLNLKDSELVVLSACETGLGNNLIGEGVIGLQRAFMIAGAKSVIMSLWSVSDEKTQELMTLFYTNWINNNMTKEEALHQAKLEMKKLYPQPYYWAGFVLLE
jgi:CHAT domain-containing protein